MNSWSVRLADQIKFMLCLVGVPRFLRYHKDEVSMYRVQHSKSSSEAACLL